tara:strand:+ start:580 stop:753 length:174 start_codon:yes stop_codon:yes gene_type:complete
LVRFDQFYNIKTEGFIAIGGGAMLDYPPGVNPPENYSEGNIKVQPIIKSYEYRSIVY